MEDLNKNQIILLTLLVSFVASVATSIMTYSLLSEAPTSVIQTVNRVVERTVETVVPAQIRPDVVTREVTVVVQEEDLIIDAIAKNQDSLVRIQQKTNSTTPEEEGLFLSIGLILDKKGLVATANTDASLEYEATLPDGVIASVKLVSSSLNFSFFKIENNGKMEFKQAVLGDSDILQLGQTVIAIKDRNRVSIGRIASLQKASGESKVSKFSLVETDFEAEGVKGGPIINLKGEIVGFNLSGLADFIPVNILKDDAGKLK